MVPIVIVVALFAFTVLVENNVAAMPAPATTIRVYAFQWGWQFTYPRQDVAPGGTGFSIVGQTTRRP